MRRRPCFVGCSNRLRPERWSRPRRRGPISPVPPTRSADWPVRTTQPSDVHHHCCMRNGRFAYGGKVASPRRRPVRPADAPLRALGYIRVSTGEQVESGAGLDSQRTKVTERAEREDGLLRLSPTRGCRPRMSTAGRSWSLLSSVSTAVTPTSWWLRSSTACLARSPTLRACSTGPAATGGRWFCSTLASTPPPRPASSCPTPWPAPHSTSGRSLASAPVRASLLSALRVSGSAGLVGAHAHRGADRA